MIRPGICGGFVRDFGGLKRNRRVTGTIETLRALLANTEAPVGVVAKGQNKDGVMFRLRSRRTHGRLFGRWSRWSLPIGRQGKREETKRGDEENEPGLHRDAQVYPPGTVRIPFADWGGNYSRPRPPTGGHGIRRGTASGEGVGTETHEQKAKITLDEAKKKRNTSPALRWAMSPVHSLSAPSSRIRRSRVLPTTVSLFAECPDDHSPKPGIADRLTGDREAVFVTCDRRTAFVTCDRRTVDAPVASNPGGSSSGCP